MTSYGLVRVTRIVYRVPVDGARCPVRRFPALSHGSELTVYTSLFGYLSALLCLSLSHTHLFLSLCPAIAGSLELTCAGWLHAALVDSRHCQQPVRGSVR